MCRGVLHLCLEDKEEGVDLYISCSVWMVAVPDQGAGLSLLEYDTFWRCIVYGSLPCFLRESLLAQSTNCSSLFSSYSQSD